ncbi:C1 family peptidase [Companilactobacillus versmoldensis]|uniref:Aminopeptidase n=1 Tax=Companilactobacillus versmoldensis DSM 14857 = KCTC 3814 TaxID=1423815 RepID=A0A0R1SCY7_9LACO|nr:C1 family peptidase [Companilactobacillus versmoldensis]KRL66414.1 cysteine aminopeptidase [Companilactobacillus versmoldensis DSM 14857 = KCTC 3814]
MTKEITSKELTDFQKSLDATPGSAAIKNAVANNGIYKSSETLASKIAMDPTFSVEIDTGSVSDQKQSGLCWAFAALNTMRHPIQNNFKIKGFELSEAYMLFWDKLEKSNYFYENVINTAALPIGDRKVDFLMATPQQDGGQWDMVMALVAKYGVVPKAVMPDTASRTNSRELNSVLNTKLRKNAVTLRKLVNDGESENDIQRQKDEMLSEIYKILVYSVGEPPEKFDWAYRDDDKKYHKEVGITPQDFFKKYVGWDLDNYISTINAPTDDKPYNHVYTVELLGNVVGGRQVRHLNLELKDFKKLAVEQLQSGETVWFGSDVVKSSDRKLGIMDTKIYDLNSLFNTDFSMTKAERLDYVESMMDHAMVITGVELDENGDPTKWKVENSWGEKVGQKGYFVMSDDWFNEYVYQLVINKNLLSDQLKTTFDKETKDPKVLAPWDPMGDLA